ncbi:MAG: thiamine phosphate synthase [Hyphomicrobiaceae bacterium]|nr:thiamine phosphate synthase [Hyphomicrobiaceae bacterium]
MGLDVFYPIVPDIGWMRRLVPLGVRTIQLRLKDANEDEQRRQIRDSLALCRAHGCQLIVNDYWQIATECGADFIHLGQEDLAEADLSRIKSAGLKLGVSTHDEAELGTALAVEPDYVALGPVYETKLKVMPWAPQGLERVTEWKRRIGDLPLVGIAGITVERAPGVIAAGAQSVAVITDFLIHPAPERRIGEWLAWAETARG